MAKPISSYKADRAMKRLGDALSVAFATWLADAQPTDLWQTCATCQHMTKQGAAFCSKFSTVPPAAVIAGVTECEAYLDEETIPF